MPEGLRCAPVNAAVIDLSGKWHLTPLPPSPSDSQTGSAAPAPPPPPDDLSIDIPGDVYTTLLQAGFLPDPFYADNERQWLPYAQYGWKIQREFEIGADLLAHGRVMLDIAVVDTIAEIHINDTHVTSSRSMFVPVLVDAAPHLRPGTNTITIHFHSAERTAREHAAHLPYPLPYSEFPIQSPHRNLIRKAQCHGGWDWGPALMTAGAYRGIHLVGGYSAGYVVRNYHCDISPTASERSSGEAGTWEVAVHVDLDVRGGADAGDVIISAAVAGGRAELSYSLGGDDGIRSVTVTVPVESPNLWWPAGHGEQAHYTLTLQVGGLRFERQVAFRTITIDNSPDEHGRALRILVNARPIMITGANWIPTDALPGRQDSEKMRVLLESARAGHINMLRVWGGGQYESEEFYRRCSEMGILVWQDFMFSCALYPADTTFLGLVRDEARAQIARLKDFPCIALWCGNNENLGALTWFPESVENRDRYLVDYDRLNEATLGEAVRALDPQRTFWPSSPCGSAGDYSANWHQDNNGDMHFWSVWHEGKPFEAYYSVIPRYCSEFGFQSFPSLGTVRAFAPPEAHNPTHPYLEHHQRHPRGNTIIIETLARYFRFPGTFSDMIYLSQLQQGLAIQTAVEYWRFHSKRCAGIMYWQLNDLWPGASWSSLEYGGGWKLLHYMVRRFYRPLHIAAFRRPADNRVICAVYNSSPRAQTVSAELQWYDGSGGDGGESIHHHRCEARIDAQSTIALDLDHTAARAVQEKADAAAAANGPGTGILTMTLTDEHGNKVENTFLYAPPKYYSLPVPDLRVTGVVPHSSEIPAHFPGVDTVYAVTLTASSLALYVAIEVGGSFSNVSDNAFPLHPNLPRTILCYVDSTKIPDADHLLRQIRLFDLSHSYE